MFLRISQNLQENTCARASFLIKLQAFIKKETLAQVFSCEFCDISKNIFLTEHLRWLLLFLWRVFFDLSGIIKLVKIFLDGWLFHFFIVEHYRVYSCCWKVQASCAIYGSFYLRMQHFALFFNPVKDREYKIKV